MAQFEELQQLWLAQPERQMAEFDPAGFGKALRRFGRIHFYVNFAKLIALLGIIPLAIIRQQGRPLTQWGIGIILAGGAAYLYLDWRNQLRISRLDYSGHSIAFVRDGLARIEQYRNPFRQGFWLPLVAISAGLQLAVIGFDRKHTFTTPTWILVEVGFVAYLFFIYHLGLKFRERRFKFECAGIHEQLLRLQQALEEQTVR